MESPNASRLKVLGLSLAAWGGLAFLFSLQHLYFVTANGRTPAWNFLFLDAAVIWGTWALLTPLILFAVRRLPLTTERAWSALLHVTTGIAVSIIHSLLVATIMPLFIWRPSLLPMRDMFRGRIASAIASDTVVYLMVVALLYAITYASESRRRQIAVAQAEASLARAQLTALQMRLQPHFLFNVLNSVLALVHEDPERADLMIRRLSDLLRYSLSRSDVDEVSLMEELQIVKGYLEIQKIRFEDRLRYDVQVESAVLNSAIPTFLLQPLVENAVKYSLIDMDKRATIAISARALGDTLKLAIVDDGPGLPATGTLRAGGTGIAATKARLEQLFGSTHRLDFSSRTDGGVTVTIDIPLRAMAIAGAQTT